MLQILSRFPKFLRSIHIYGTERKNFVETSVWFVVTSAAVMFYFVE